MKKLLQNKRTKDNYLKDYQNLKKTYIQIKMTFRNVIPFLKRKRRRRNNLNKRVKL